MSHAGLSAAQLDTFRREGVVFPQRALVPADAARHAAALRAERSALLVRGTDRHGHWDPDPAPAGDDDPAIEAFMRDAFQRYRDQEASPAA